MSLSILVASMLIGSQVTPVDLERGFARDFVGAFTGGSVIVAQLFVSPVGVVESCSIVSTNWPQRSADRACERIKGRKLSQVARSGDGTPMYGTVLFSLSARPDGARSPPPLPYTRLPDLTVSVARLPDDVDKVTVGTLVLVDTQGSIVECSANPDAKAASAAFVDVACAQLQQIHPAVRNGIDGNAVPYITDLTVEFVVDA